MIKKHSIDFEKQPVPDDAHAAVEVVGGVPTDGVRKDSWLEMLWFHHCGIQLPDQIIRIFWNLICSLELALLVNWGIESLSASYKKRRFETSSW